MLVSATIKDFHGDAMTCIESLVREWMAQDMRLARERMTESAPPDVHHAPPDFSPPPPRGESTPPPKAAQLREDVGDVNTVTPAVEDVEIWDHTTRGPSENAPQPAVVALGEYAPSPFEGADAPLHRHAYTFDGCKFTRHLGKLFACGEAHPGSLEDGGELGEEHVDKLVADCLGDTEQCTMGSR
ncbi:unnamed protein product [Closterium sp. NIES-64]|nr:unnamed protein product [Closterium sp. NIES-64]